MVKYKRYGRSTYWAKKNFNKIASTYMKYKVAVNFEATWSGTNAPYITFGTNYGSIVTAEQIFGNTGNEYLTLRGYYSFYKLTGIAMEITPTISNASNGEFRISGSAVMGIVQSGETLTYNTLSQSPQAIGLDINNKSRKYISLKSAWTPTNLIANSAIKLCTAANAGVAAGSIRFNVRLVLYMTFKNPI